MKKKRIARRGGRRCSVADGRHPKIKQDTYRPSATAQKITEVPTRRLIPGTGGRQPLFSDEFSRSRTEGTGKVCPVNVSHFNTKKMRRGDYSPELFLDLRGLTQLQAKQNWGADCRRRREHILRLRHAWTR